MKKSFLTGLLATLILMPGASGKVIQLDQKGMLEVDDLAFGTTFHLPSGGHSQKDSWQRDKIVLTELAPDRAEFDLKMPRYDHGRMIYRLVPQADGSFDFSSDLAFQEEVQSNGIVLTTQLSFKKYLGRTIVVNGQPVALLTTYQKGGDATFFSTKNGQSLEVPTSQGTLIITGKDLRISVMDRRTYGPNNHAYALRILYTPYGGSLKETHLAFNVAYRKFTTTPLDLRAAANMGFADEAEGDNQGGWTDQGPENDLRNLPVGRQNFHGITYDIIDPGKNGGRSCVMMRGKDRPLFSAEAVAPQNGKVHGRYLYLLHAKSWGASKNELGTITLTYADGTQSTVTALQGRDAGNWWSPTPRSNGSVAWVGTNAMATVGLYTSIYPIEDKPITNVKIASAGNAVWGIAAMSVGCDKLEQPKSEPYYVLPGKEWQDIAIALDVEPGSALDFSPALDAPAGKYGRVVVRNGRFEFQDRPGVPARFFGTNAAVDTPVLDKELAPKFADRLAAFGFNALRLHHHDGALSRRDDTTQMDPENNDRLDYLIYCCKQRGIYVTTDFYISRRLPPGEISFYSGRLSNITEYKALLWIDDEVYDNWKRHVTNYVNHVNPYTKMRLVDDPVLISVNVINEGNIKSCWNASGLTAKRYNAAFDQWLKDHDRKFGNDAERGQLFSEFLNAVYTRRYAQMVKLLRELGVKCPLSDQNMGTTPMLEVMRSAYDYVDNHGYFCHPQFPERSWQLPSTLRQISPIKSDTFLPYDNMVSRLYGKPFTITEFDYAAPNVYRGEGPAFIAVVAALQEWDGLYQFAFSHRAAKLVQPTPKGHHFDVAGDVVKHFTMRLGAMVFLKGGLKPLPAKTAVLLDGKVIDVNKNFPAELRKVAALTQLGTVVSPQGVSPVKLDAALDLGYNFPEGAFSKSVIKLVSGQTDLPKELIQAKVAAPEAYDAATETMRSATGEVVISNGQHSLTAATANAEVLILPPRTTAQGRRLAVKNLTGTGVFGAVTTDGQALATAPRITLFHVTDALPFKAQFADSTMTWLDAWGDARRQLASPGTAEVEFALPEGAEYSVFALDAAGRRLAEVPAVKAGGKLSFKVSVFNKFGSVFAYELVRK